MPTDITQRLSDVFVKCNELVTEKLCNNPNIQEEWLDYSWIEQLSRFSTPVTLGSGWIARVQAHYLGACGTRACGRLPTSACCCCPEPATPDGPLELGVRLVPSQTIHDVLPSQKKTYRPMIKELKAGRAPDGYGWRLEDFMAAELLGCREGARFESTSQPSIDALFNRRSGPIAAAISITIEAPPGVLD